MQDRNEDTIILEEATASYPIYSNGFVEHPTTEVVPDSASLRALAPGARAFKRGLDLFLVTVTGVVWLPLMALIALAIRIGSRGGVFFIQERPGRGLKDFKIYKFRTMHCDASHLFENLTPAQQEEFRQYGKIQDDPRVTPIGKWLRRFSLDELPQLLNVIKGEMSLVGPRPYLTEQLPYLHHTDIIFGARPGLTGLWQISGRSLLPLESRIDLDVHYVRDWTVGMDLKILAKTIVVVLKSTGAF